MNSYEKLALYGKPSVGGDILTYCSRCKMELAHVISAMVDGAPAKVVCKTCRGEHKFHKTGGGTAASKPKLTGGIPKLPKATIRLSEHWEKRISESKASVPHKYSVQMTFKQNDLVEHVKFGLGIVEEVATGGKIKVLFKDEERILIHGKK